MAKTMPRKKRKTIWMRRESLRRLLLSVVFVTMSFTWTSAVALMWIVQSLNLQALTTDIFFLLCPGLAFLTVALFSARLEVADLRKRRTLRQRPESRSKEIVGDSRDLTTAN